MILLQLIIFMHYIIFFHLHVVIYYCSLHLVLFISQTGLHILSTKNLLSVTSRFRIVAMSVIVHLNPQKICRHVYGRLPVCLISLPTSAASAAVAITPKAKEIFRMAGKVFYIIQKYFSNQISHVFKNYHHMVSEPNSLSSNKFGVVNQAALILHPPNPRPPMQNLLVRNVLLSGGRKSEVRFWDIFQ
jgi:hypothetical protein